MTKAAVLGCATSAPAVHIDPAHLHGLLNGDISLQTRSHSAWGGAVTAQIYLPMERSQIWQQLIDYPRWVQYFPDLTHSEVIGHNSDLHRTGKRLYQVASKAFLLFSAQVEIYLRAFETAHQTIQFHLEKGSFTEFAAELNLVDVKAMGLSANGTILTYAVQATPVFPVPSALIQEAMRFDLPTNLRKMRQVLCQ